MFDLITVCICEGAHDVAFLNRLLTSKGFSDYAKTRKIKDFFSPFNNKFIESMSRTGIPEKKIGFQDGLFEIPSCALHLDNNLVFLHSMGGDASIDNRRELIRSYLDIKGDDDFSDFNFNYRFILFFDADEDGIDARENQVSELLGIKDCKVGHVFEKDGSTYGLYVFHKPHHQTGTLEDLIFDIVQEQAAVQLTSAEAFLAQNELPEARQRRYSVSNGAGKYSGAVKYKKYKSKLAIIGQLQFSGMSNSAIINSTDYICLENIHGHECCTEIHSLFT
ncbi:hypothetical protein ACEUC2_12180 [Aeromonas veronii]